MNEKDYFISLNEFYILEEGYELCGLEKYSKIEQIDTMNF